MKKLQADKNTILTYVFKKYSTVPDYPWSKYPDYMILRHRDSRKWYGIIMRIASQKLGINSIASVDVVNLKCEPELIGSLRQKPGYFPAYHMNKEHWLTILLDKSLPLQEVCNLIDISYNLTATRKNNI